MKRVTCKSGLEGWQGKLHEVYTDFAEFSRYAEALGLHFRLGYSTPLHAWQDNPTVQGSVIPADYCKVNPLKRYPRAVAIAHARKMNTPANARKLARVDKGHYTVSKPQRRTLTVITCARAKRLYGSAPRPYGYTLAIFPPDEHAIEGRDVEGIGWVPYNPPRRFIVNWQGWYKYKALAQKRADDLNK